MGCTGHLIDGDDGVAREPGHRIVRAGVRVHAGTGMKGSLETYAAATGIAFNAKESLDERKSEESLLRNIPQKKIDAKVVYEAAAKGDKIAKEVFNGVGRLTVFADIEAALVPAVFYRLM